LHYNTIFPLNREASGADEPEFQAGEAASPLGRIAAREKSLQKRRQRRVLLVSLVESRLAEFVDLYFVRFTVLI
jgi:hypothetical protein